MNNTQLLALLSTLMPFIVGGVKYLYELLMARMPNDGHKYALESIVSTVVSGVEQSSNGQTGPEKKQAASAAVQELAAAFGLQRYANPAVVDMLIEAAVFEMNSVQSPAVAQEQPASESSVPALESVATPPNGML